MCCKKIKRKSKRKEKKNRKRKRKEKNILLIKKMNGFAPTHHRHGALPPVGKKELLNKEEIYATPLFGTCGHLQQHVQDDTWFLIFNAMEDVYREDRLKAKLTDIDINGVTPDFAKY